MRSQTMRLVVDSALPLRRYLGQAALHVVLLLFSFIAAAPFIWMIFGSFKRFKELTSSMYLLPQVWTLDNYAAIILRVNFVAAFRNSTIVAVLTTVAVLLTSAANGYVFAKYQFPGKDQLFALLLSTMMVPFAVVMVPLYIFMVDIGAVNGLSAIILPGLWSTFGIFLLRQFMESVPSELIDACRIDGASEWRIFGQIMLPLSGAPLAALAIMHFLGSWDSFMWPSIVLRSPDKQTLPIVLAGLRDLWWERYDMWMAGSMLTVVPVMLIYAFASRQFVRGLAMTGMRG
ncbi:MAG: carbohydrate ABC transporter permease [Chloroflexi bacterium]|nr:carbohydrate ABC transporter permease [Chloroflexota bacterium]